MKKVIRLTSFLLCLMLLLSCLPAPAVVLAEGDRLIEDRGDKIRSGKAKINIVQSGTTRTYDPGYISAEGKPLSYIVRRVSGSTSGLKAANGKLIIPANFAGLALIRVTDHTYYTDFRLCVAPKAPAFALSSTEKGKVKVSWTKLAGVSGYRIEYKYLEDGSVYHTIDIPDPGRTNEVITGLNPNKTVSVRVYSFVRYDFGGEKFRINSRIPKAKTVEVSRRTNDIKLTYFKMTLKGMRRTIHELTIDMVIGEELPLEVKNFKPANATNKSVEWISSDKSVATISNTGVVKALSKGTTTITAKACDGGGFFRNVWIRVK